MAILTYRDFPLLKGYVEQILEVFKANPDKTKAHKISTPVMKSMTQNPEVLREIIRLNMAQPGFFVSFTIQPRRWRLSATPIFILS